MLLGCAWCHDELEHYLQCPHLFTLWRFLAANESEDAHAREGLRCLNSMHFLVGLLVCSAGTTLSNGLFVAHSLINRTVNHYSSSQYREFWSVVAGAISAHARELMVSHCKLSLPGF